MKGLWLPDPTNNHLQYTLGRAKGDPTVLRECTDATLEKVAEAAVAYVAMTTPQSVEECEEAHCLLSDLHNKFGRETLNLKDSDKTQIFHAADIPDDATVIEDLMADLRVDTDTDTDTGTDTEELRQTRLELTCLGKEAYIWPEGAAVHLEESGDVIVSVPGSHFYVKGEYSSVLSKLREDRLHNERLIQGSSIRDAVKMFLIPRGKGKDAL